MNKTLYQQAYDNNHIDKETYDKICEVLEQYNELKELKEMFEKATPKELLSDSKKMFSAFLKSNLADDIDIRSELIDYQSIIESFFMKVANNKISLT